MGAQNNGDQCQTDQSRTHGSVDPANMSKALDKETASGGPIPAAASATDEEDEYQIAMDTAWDRHGKVWIWIGIALMWTIFELDHTTIYNYQNYAASEFDAVALLGALTTSGTIVSAVLKPPIAKISDVLGRAETYIAVVLFYVLSYILCAAARSWGMYQGGFVIYSIGSTGMQILNQVIVADITSSRWRGLANGLVNLPFMIIPWCSAFIVDSAIINIGWRWGVGMFAIIMPVTALVVILQLLTFQRRLKQAGRTVREPVSMHTFCTRIDLSGLLLLSGGCAMILLPIALAGSAPKGWKTPWVSSLIVIGVIFLLILIFYEFRIATQPVIPPRFIRNTSLVLAFAIGLLDAFAYSITHTYLYAWATVVHAFSPRNATFLTYAAGCVQVLTGLATGFMMFRTKRYKLLLLIGIIVRLCGYGFMLSLRGANNSVGEIFVMQIIQGAGSGIVGSIVIVVAQVVVPRSELAQATALELLCIYLGNSIGSSIAGTIYTSLFKKRLRIWLGSDASPTLIDSVFESIIESVPDSGTPERTAVNHAYSDILRYMTIAALTASVIPMVLVWFVPNLKLSDKHNLTTSLSEQEQHDDSRRTENDRIQRWKRRLRW